MSQPETGFPSKLFLLNVASTAVGSKLTVSGQSQATAAGEILVTDYVKDDPVVILSSLRQPAIETAALVAEVAPTLIYDEESSRRDYLNPEEYSRDICDIRQRLSSVWATLSACGLRHLLLVMHSPDMRRLGGVVRGEELPANTVILPGELWFVREGQITSVRAQQGVFSVV